MQKARKPLEIKGLRVLKTQENCHLPCQMDDLEPNEPLSHPARHTGMYKMQQKTTGFHLKSVVLRVEVAGFEPAAFWSRTKRATKLRYTSVADQKSADAAPPVHWSMRVTIKESQ